MKKVISLLLFFILVLSLSCGSVAKTLIKDITNHWAKDYIDYLTGNGAIKGYTDGTFRPDNKISRAEFTAILLRALNNDVGQPKEGKWYANYISEATNRKYILAGEFDDMEKNIIRGEMARMIVRAMSETYPANMADYASQLADYGKTPEEYKDFSLKAYVKGIITGRPGGLFAHAELATRAEATTMIVRLIDTTKRVIPPEPVSKDEHTIAIGDEKIVFKEDEYINAVNKGKEILIGQGILDSYIIKNSASNAVQYYLYITEDEKESYNSSLRFEVDSGQLLTYSLVIRDVENRKAVELFKKIINELFPDVKEFIADLLNKKIADPMGYQVKVMQKEGVYNRQVNLFLFENSKQFSVYMAKGGNAQ